MAIVLTALVKAGGLALGGRRGSGAVGAQVRHRDTQTNRTCKVPYPGVPGRGRHGPTKVTCRTEVPSGHESGSVETGRRTGLL